MARTEPRSDREGPSSRTSAPPAGNDAGTPVAPSAGGRHAAPGSWRIVRTPNDRILTGTAGGLGERLGVDPVIVRLSFVVLAFAAGVGVIAYLVCWALSVDPPPEWQPPPQPSPEVVTQRAVAIGMVVFGLLFVCRGIGAWFGDAIVWPVALGAVGSAIIWTRADRERRARWTLAAQRLPRRVDTFLNGPVSVLRILFGGMLILGGMTVFLAANHAFGLSAVRNVLFAVGVTVVGAVLILGPGVWRLVKQLGAERRERIRSEERAEVAAHLHDSVLQSLAMIQRARTAEEMATLARAQERELRAWLYAGGPAPGGTLRGSIEEVAGRVEALHHVEVEVVQVGDAIVDERLQALVQAAGEAMTNAARHSGARRIDVYVEVEPALVSAFVRDRGKGFDLETVPEDRHGIAESIERRMERAGGTATLTTAPGEGTEVALRMPRPAQ
ncbi:MAG TPA: PspC domain-containing protein [Actinomycetota bacterium]|nr:PspC domain-containing protein [Actinomycetota bacterium]